MSKINKTFEYFDPTYHLAESLYSAIRLFDHMASNPLQEWINSLERFHPPFQKIDFGVSIPDEMLSLNKLSLFADNQIYQMFDTQRTIQSLQNNFSSPFISSYAKLVNNIANLDDNNYDEFDYVIVDEHPIKEICIPDSLAVPIGKYRVKIKTDQFIAIIFGILSLIVSFMSFISASPDIDQRQEEQIYIQTQQWQNQILNRLLDSIDASSSSQAKAIEALREAVEAQSEAVEAQFQALDAQAQAVEALREAADSSQQSNDNTNKSESIECNEQP